MLRWLCAMYIDLTALMAIMECQMLLNTYFHDFFLGWQTRVKMMCVCVRFSFLATTPLRNNPHCHLVMIECEVWFSELLGA